MPCALVAADTPDIAEEALELIDVEYEPLPAVYDVEAAMTIDARAALFAVRKQHLPQ